MLEIGRDPDIELVAAIRRRDAEAFRKWMERNHGWVRAVVYAILGDPDQVDDVCQQVWAAAWWRIGGISDNAKWKPWLYMLARNAAFDAGRKRTRRRRHERVLISSAREEPNQDGSAMAGFVRDEDRKIVLETLESLPPIYREPFVLRHLEGWSYQAIAELLEMPVDTVETRLVRAMRKMRERLLKREEWADLIRRRKNRDACR